MRRNATRTLLALAVPAAVIALLGALATHLAGAARLRSNDDVADPLAMRAAFSTFQRHRLSREVSLVYGNHTLASAYLDTDKALIPREAQKFLGALAVAAPAQ